MRNRGENDSFARRDAESLVSGVTVGPRRQIGPGDDFFVADQLPNEGSLLHSGAFGSLSQNALLFLCETDGENSGHSMPFVCLCFHSSSALISWRGRVTIERMP